MIAQQILTVQRALQSGVGQIDLEGSSVRIDRGCALFVTTDSLQDCGQDKEHIPDNLKVREKIQAIFTVEFRFLNALLLF